MLTHHKKRSLVAALCSAIAAGSLVSQTNGTWITAGSGPFSTTTNWQDGIVPGSDGTANFASVNLPAGAATVTLDTAVSLSALTFGDTDTSTAGTWALAGTATLTLGGTTPTITTNVTTAVNAGVIFAGSNGFTKEGTGQLTIFSNAFTLTGPINLNAGTLALNRIGGTGSASATVGTGQINMANGTTLRMDSGGNTFISNAVSIASGASATITSANAANGYSGSVTGDASSTLVIGGATQVSFNANALQLNNFLGTVTIGSTASLRFSSSTTTFQNGGNNTSFVIDGNVTTRNAGTVNLGKISGSGTITAASGADGTATFVIGAKNEDSTFAGSINNTSATRIAAITKTGSGTLTLSGVNGYTGTTTVTAGTLAIGASDRLADTTRLILNGGTFASNGFNETLGALTLSATSTIDFGSSETAALVFADSSAQNWAGLNLNLVNFSGSDSLRFGTSSTALVPEQIAKITVNGASGVAALDSNGFLTVSAIPEPSAYAAILGAFALGFAAWRRRRA